MKEAKATIWRTGYDYGGTRFPANATSLRVHFGRITRDQCALLERRFDPGGRRAACGEDWEPAREYDLEDFVRPRIQALLGMSFALDVDPARTASLSESKTLEVVGTSNCHATTLALALQRGADPSNIRLFALPDRFANKLFSDDAGFTSRVETPQPGDYTVLVVRQRGDSGPVHSATLLDTSETLFVDKPDHQGPVRIVSLELLHGSYPPALYTYELRKFVTFPEPQDLSEPRLRVLDVASVPPNIRDTGAVPTYVGGMISEDVLRYVDLTIPLKQGQDGRFRVPPETVRHDQR